MNPLNNCIYLGNDDDKEVAFHRWVGDGIRKTVVGRLKVLLDSLIRALRISTLRTDVTPAFPLWFSSPRPRLPALPLRVLRIIFAATDATRSYTATPRQSSSTLLPEYPKVQNLRPNACCQFMACHYSHNCIETFFEIPTITARPSNFEIALLSHPASPAKPPSPRTTTFRVLDNEKYARQPHIWTDPRSVAGSGAPE
ncbi:hypothetical protein HYPSUDRAFT_817355 [Hypholoma sublateritium FD-334 SS-4]|uniref:Uncharacterized protein n=1 Tax=Hypholoma sublateritium (strain FD-334 SS-4) TaxID=945553 RepID=A0A0D2MAF7_HYPSF|nr:hypothetical protein HYPSUDRAFT_817355 [Hypholoma sublateritium FD-334 SS-4]